MVNRTLKQVAGLSLAALFALALTLPVQAEVKEEFHKTVPLSANSAEAGSANCLYEFSRQ